jgi:glutamate/tyrosine decarboxylase-like PLP-dependent enzyme
VQWSRRFLGLRLLLSLAAAGWRGYGEHVERSVALAMVLRDRLAACGWSVTNDPALAVLCIEPEAVRSVDVPNIVRRLVQAGQIWISLARFERRNVIRACITNGETRLTDIEMFVDALQAAAADAAS